MLYRCRQRGLLELDLIIGVWAEENIAKLNAEELDELERIIDLENPDLLKWLCWDVSQLRPSC